MEEEQRSVEIFMKVYVFRTILYRTFVYVRWRTESGSASYE